MKTVGELRAILGLDKSKFDKGINQAEKKTSKFGAGIKKLAGAMAAVFAVGKIIQWAKAAKAAYTVQAEAEIKLATIMKQRMGLGKQAVEDLKKQAAAQQNIGVIGDEVQLSGLQQLATFLKQKESLEALLPAMNNLLAQQKGNNAQAVDAVNVANMMGKVLDGQVASLRRIGITFTEAQGEAMKTGNEFERSAMLAEVITNNVGNMNEELGKTDMGKVTRWNNAWGDFKEMLGSALMPILGKIAEWGLKTLPKVIQTFSGIKKVIVGVINYFIDLYNESTAIRAVIQAIVFVVRTLWASFKTGISITIGYFKILGSVLKDVFTGNWKAIGDHVRDGLKGIQEDVADYGEAIADNWQKLMENMTKKPHVQLIKIKPVTGNDTPISGIGPIGEDTGGGVAGAVNRGLAGINTSAGAAALPQLAAPIDSLTLSVDNLKDKFLDLGYVTNEVFEGLQDSLFDAFTGTENILKAFGKSFAEFIKQMIAKLVAATVASLVLAAAMSLIPGLGATMGFDKMASFGDMFKGLMQKSMGTGLQAGGTIPPGYPNDTFPAMLSSGERVLSAQQSRIFEKGIDVFVEGEISARTIALSGRRSSITN